MVEGKRDVMTKDKLEQLRWLRKEMDDINGKMALLDGERMPVVKDRVKASGRNWPFIEGHATVQGSDERAVLKKSMERERLQIAWTKRRDEAAGLRIEIEEYISTIEDSRIRQMIEYRYVDGYSSKEVGRRMNCDRTTVERTIDKYLKDHQ
jgi:DNA-directed RNA polymerase specialized sigma24 family protein